MDFKDFMNLSVKADTLSGIMLYVLTGIGALLLILFIVWLLFKLSNFIKNRKENKFLKKEPSDEEQLFGE